MNFFRKEKIDYKNLPDDRLVDLVTAGNPDAIEYFFYQKFSATFQYHIYNLFPFKVDVPALVDEFFLFLFENDWKRLRTFDRNKAALSTWISTVSFRFFRDYKTRVIDLNGQFTINDRWEQSKLDWVSHINTGIQIDVQRAISQIENDRDRQIANEIYIQDVEFEKIAEKHEISVDYLYTIKNRISNKLKKALKSYI